MKQFNQEIANMDIVMYDVEVLQIAHLLKSKRKFVAIYEHSDGKYFAVESDTIEELVQSMSEIEDMEDSFLRGAFKDKKPMKINYQKSIKLSFDL